MMKVTRRQVATGLGLAALAGPGIGRPALALGAPKVVIIGGGPGGASVAVLSKKADPNLDITLIEPKTKYTSCFFSNHYIGGFRSFSSITHTYAGLGALGIKVVHDIVTGIDAGKKRVALKSGKALDYDRLAVSPGIDFKWGEIQGYDEAAAEIMPHAWKGGPQTQLLRERLEKLEDGGTVVLAPPKMPYRCPPGPYERACVIANFLKTEKPKSKLVILDPKMTFSKQAVFQEAFEKYYKDIVELHLTNDIDDFSVTRVDTRTGEVTTKAGLTVKAALANIVPAQTAGDIALKAGLAEGDWCPVKLDTFLSAKLPDIYVLGDAAIGAEMPKSAFTAHSQALMVTAGLLTELSGRPREAAHFRNTCWSLLAPGESVKIGADYTPGELNGKPALVPANAFVSKPGEDAAVRKEVFQESLAWYNTLISEIFQKPMQPQVGHLPDAGSAN